MLKHRVRLGCVRARVPGLACLILACLSGFAQAQEAEDQGIPWRGDYTQALAEAQAKGLPLWVQFSGPWCPGCRKMDEEVFVERSIIAIAHEKCIPLKLRPDESEELTTAFQIEGLPATVLVAPDRTVLAKREGFTDAAELETVLDAAARKVASAEGRRRLVANRDAKSAGQPRLALEGHCPVGLVVDRKLEPGLKDYEVIHAGFVYRCDSPECLEAFRAEPERYAPSNSGNCPVSLAIESKEVPGNPRFGAIFRGRLFVCADAESRARFIADPRRFADAAIRLRAKRAERVAAKPSENSR